MEKKKDLVMVAVVTLVAIGLLISATALVRGVISVAGIALESLGG